MKPPRKPMTFAARVAAEVMQWGVCRDGRCEGCDSPVYYRAPFPGCSVSGWSAEPGGWVVIDQARDGGDWSPETKPEHLLDVIGELRRRGLDTTIEISPEEVYVAVSSASLRTLGSEELTPRGANTWQLCLARAVCRAAIEAVSAGGSDA